MSALPTRREAEIYRRVSLIKDPVREARRRWPDFSFEQRPGKDERGRPVLLLEARWTRSGVSRGLKEHLRPNATGEEIGGAEKRVAFGALLAAEQER